MSERLRQLRRQQALLQQNLARIEAEIARETPPVETALAAPTGTITPAVTTSPDVALPDADALIERYASDERQNPSEVRRGCLLITIAALLLIAGAVTAIWMIYYR